MNILISGVGIAGPTLAYWLSRYGIEATLVEKAPRLRTGGYIIDFWGAGFDIADRMGLLPEMQRRGYSVQEIRVVDRQGKKIAGFPTEAVARVTQGRFVSIPRGDLAELIFREIEGHVETIFGDSVTEIRQTDNSFTLCTRNSTNKLPGLRCAATVRCFCSRSRRQSRNWGPPGAKDLITEALREQRVGVPADSEFS